MELGWSDMVEDLSYFLDRINRLHNSYELNEKRRCISMIYDGRIDCERLSTFFRYMFTNNIDIEFDLLYATSYSKRSELIRILLIVNPDYIDSIRPDILVSLSPDTFDIREPELSKFITHHKDNELVYLQFSNSYNIHYNLFALKKLLSIVTEHNKNIKKQKDKLVIRRELYGMMILSDYKYFVDKVDLPTMLCRYVLSYITEKRRSLYDTNTDIEITPKRFSNTTSMPIKFDMEDFYYRYIKANSKSLPVKNVLQGNYGLSEYGTISKTISISIFKGITNALCECYDAQEIIDYVNMRTMRNSNFNFLILCGFKLFNKIGIDDLYIFRVDEINKLNRIVSEIPETINLLDEERLNKLKLNTWRSVLYYDTSLGKNMFKYKKRIDSFNSILKQFPQLKIELVDNI